MLFLRHIIVQLISIKYILIIRDFLAYVRHKMRCVLHYAIFEKAIKFDRKIRIFQKLIKRLKNNFNALKRLLKAYLRKITP